MSHRRRDVPGGLGLSLGLRVGGPLLGGGAFSPTDLPGLEFWFETTNASTIIESGGDVSQWNDQSGNGRNISQGSAPNQPELVTDGGDSAISYTAASNTKLFATGLGVTGLSADWTYFAVWRQLFGGSQTPVGFGTTSGNNGDMRSGTNPSTFMSNNTFMTLTSAAPGVVRHYYIWRVADDDADGIDDLGNTITDTNNTPVVTALDDIFSGSNVDSGSDFTGFKFEFGAYSNKISDADRTALGSYLGNKWGL